MGANQAGSARAAASVSGEFGWAGYAAPEAAAAIPGTPHQLCACHTACAGRWALMHPTRWWWRILQMPGAAGRSHGHRCQTWPACRGDANHLCSLPPRCHLMSCADGSWHGRQYAALCRFKSSPLATSKPRIRFFAGAPLLATRSGECYGAHAASLPATGACLPCSIHCCWLRRRSGHSTVLCLLQADTSRPSPTFLACRHHGCV